MGCILNTFVSSASSPSCGCSFMKQKGRIAQLLEKDGHRCIFYLETYPVQISWCGNEDKCVLEEDESMKGFLNKNFFKIKRVFI